jgi:nucleotide-binding universal stress UspA family protein
MLVVVGVDLSDASRRALEWAAREAQSHHGRLTACWTGRLPATAIPAGAGEPGSARGSLDKIEDDILALIAEWAPDLEPDVRLGASVVEAGADELLELSRSADLLVLACSHEGHWGRPSAVNVRRVIGRATCPVVLVP